ncbi:MAG TPA: DUF2336 domain-containing protein [Xanthobacteraceae bacterium]|nr:DUF2336 domain-containing protein [Xanthobacteraceae bacterium]
MVSSDIIISELEDALSHGSVERRAKTLRRVTDLFVFSSGHCSEDHIDLFDSIFSRLIADIETSARAILADRLATVPNAPPTVIRKLAFDDSIEVAQSILKKSDALDNATLVENASTKSQQHLLAISQRKSLAETVTDVLVERGNREVALSTVRNMGAKFSEVGYVRLIKRSEGDDEFAVSFGSRPEIPRHHFIKFLTKASHSVRLKLESENPQYAAEIRQAVADVATAMQTKAAAASHDYHAACALVESMQASGRLGEGEVEAFARAGKFEETAAALAVLCNLPIDIIERAMMQEDPGAGLIIVKAAGLSWLAARALLLLRAGARGVSPQALDEAMVSFTRLKRETAQRVVEFQRKRQQAAFPAGP